MFVTWLSANMMLRFLSSCLAALPSSFFYGLSSLLAAVLSRFYRPKLVKANLERAFPEASAEARNNIARDCYLNLSDVAMESLRGASMSRTQLLDLVKIEESDDLKALRQHNAPFLLYASHYCNWEWIALAFGLQVAPVDPIYKPLSTGSADKWMYSYRSRFGNKPIHIDRVGGAIRHLTDFRGIGVVADQSPSKGNKGKVWTSFLDLPTPFYRGIFALPYLTQWPAYYASMQRVKRGQYLVKVEPMGSPSYAKNDYEVLRNYIRLSEAEIRKMPAHWLWTHNRWKYEQRDSEELLIFRK